MNERCFTKQIKSKRQPANLKRMLTKARFDEQEQEHTVSKCERSNCGLCPHLLEGNTFSFTNGKSFTIKTSMSCDVQNVIYVMRCCGCQKEYIGETGEFLRKRMTVHRQQIRDSNTRMLFVSEHIDTCAREKNPAFTVFPMLKLLTSNAVLRKEKEHSFIKIFKPPLNSRD